MGIMAGSALKLLVLKADLGGQRRRIPEMPVFQGQHIIIHKGDRVVVRQIRAEVRQRGRAADGAHRP